MENQDIEIVYGRYPYNLALYSRRYNKIYINEIIKKYPLCLDSIKQHEMLHYKNNFHKYNLVILFWDSITDWKDMIETIRNFNSELNKERRICESEFLNLNFTKEEKKQYREIFLPSFPSKLWVYQKIYEFIKPGVNILYIFIMTPTLYVRNWLTVFNFIYFYIIIRIIYVFIILLLKK